MLAQNGKIYCIPFDAETILVIDPQAQCVSCFGEVGSSKQKWWNGVLAPDGMIYCIPHNADTVLVIDPVSHVIRHLGNMPIDQNHIPGRACKNGVPAQKWFQT